MWTSIVNVEKEPPIREEFKSFLEGWSPYDWQDAFPGEGSLTVGDGMLEFANLWTADYHFAWGSKSRAVDFRKFRHYHRDQLYAVYEVAPSSSGQKVLIASRPTRTIAAGVRCLSRAIRILRKDAVLPTFNDGHLFWNATDKARGHRYTLVETILGEYAVENNTIHFF